MQKTVSAGSHTVTLTSTTTPNATFECEPFNTQSQSSVSITGCPETITNHNPNDAIVLNPITITGCSECTCSVSPSSTDVSGCASSMNFYYVSGSGTKQHTLTARSSDGSTGTCTFSVTYNSVSSSSVQPVSSSSVEISSSSEAETSSSMVTTSTSVEPETSTSVVTTSSSAAPASSSSNLYCSAGAVVKTFECNASNQATGDFGTTGAVCIKIHGSLDETHGGWGFSNSAGRQWSINGGTFGTTAGGTLQAASDGYIYIDVTKGTHTYAAINWYNCNK